MSYTGSKSQTGQFAVFSILGPVGGTGTVTPTIVGELEDVPFKEPPLKMVDVTNLQSTIEEQVPVIPGVTNFTLTANRVATDPGQILMHAAFIARVPYNFTFALAPNVKTGQTTTGDSWAFSAYVTEASIPTVKATEIVKVNYGIQYVTLPAFTAGA